MRKFILIPFIFLLSGCSIMSNWNELMTLNEYSNEKNDQRQMMELADKHFDILKDDYRQGRLPLQTTTTVIQKKYGNPFGIKKITGSEMWLYRYGVWYKKSDKLYLTFNDNNQLVTVEYVEDK